jgi:hypothetical protein
MTEKLEKEDLLKRLKNAFIIFLAILSISFGLYYGLPYLIYKIEDKLEARNNVKTMIENEYCIFTFCFNKLTSDLVDKDISDGCISSLTFDSDYLYIRSKTLKLKAKYEVLDEYHIRITNSENTNVLENSEYSISLTKRGINIIGNKFELLADKMKNNAP